MHHLTSPFIKSKYEAGETSGQLGATSLFVDVSGFSAMTSTLMQHGQHGAEVLATIMRAVFDPLVEAVYAYGGFITVFAGDAFTAIFPADDAGAIHNLTDTRESLQQALAAAWTMQQHLRAHFTHDTLYGQFSITAKIGLAMGRVDWGIIHAEDGTRAAFYFRGTAIDNCAQAEQHAASGDLILHPSAYELLADKITVESVSDYWRVIDIKMTLPEAQSAILPPVDLEIESRFFPREIIEQTYSGEFRQALNVFINLKGSPSQAQIEQFMNVVFKLQTKYGGLLNRLDFGDKGCSLLLFWGAPISHENDIVRALNFLLELHDEARIPMRAGVTSRISHAGFIGSTLHEEYTCYGNGVNLAARMMTTAPWESIWIDEQVKLRAEHQFELESEGAQSFKGFDEPQDVYSLLGYQATDVLSLYDRKMVGRQKEISQITSFVEPLWNAEGQTRFAGILVVRGEAGMGKSRLVHEFQDQTLAIQDRVSPRWLLCQTDPILHQPLNPFRYWLRDYLGQVTTQSEAHNKRVFSRKLAQLINATTDATLKQELEQSDSILGALVDLHWENSLYASLDPQSRYESTINTLKTLILVESLRQPVIIQLEDIHWLDANSIEFVQRLCRNIEHYPIALIATVRAEATEPYFGDDTPYQQLELTNLVTTELSDLVANILENNPGPQLLALLGERGEGNPFFTEQISLYLRDEGLLEKTGAGWEPRAEALKVTPLPTNVRAIFIARLDRLVHDVREVVQAAAVLGREFEIQVLDQMLRDDNIRHHIQKAEQAAVWSALTELRYLFKHVLLRDAAYDIQVQTRRAELHRLAAQSLEMIYATDLVAHTAEIAYHYETAYQSGIAQLAALARRYLTMAGDQAMERYENTSAVDYFTRALTLLPKEDPETRFALLQKREQAYHYIGNREPQKHDLEALQALADMAQNPVWQMHVTLRWANFYETISDYTAEAEYGQKLIALAQATGDVTNETEGYFEWGTALYRKSQLEEAVEKLKHAYLMAKSANLFRLQADALLIWAYVSTVQGKPDLARTQLDEALPIYQTTGNRYGEMNVFNSIGILEYNMGRFTDSQSWFERAANMAREMGRRLALGRFIGNIGYAASNMGDYDTARALTDESIRIFRDIGHIDGEGIALVNLGLIAIREGDYIRAVKNLERSIDIGREVDDRVQVAEALSYLSLTKALSGNYLSAQTVGQEALDLSRKVEDKQHEALALTALGHVHTALSKYAEAAEHYQTACALRREIGQEAAALEAQAGLGRVALAQGDIPNALTEIAPIADYLLPKLNTENRTDHGLNGAEAPLWVWLTWYQVWQATNDPRAADVLAHAYATLQAEIERIEDAEARRMYVENVPYRSEIVSEYTQLSKNKS